MPRWRASYSLDNSFCRAHNSRICCKRVLPLKDSSRGSFSVAGWINSQPSFFSLPESGVPAFGRIFLFFFLFFFGCHGSQSLTWFSGCVGSQSIIVAAPQKNPACRLSGSRVAFGQPQGGLGIPTPDKAHFDLGPGRLHLCRLAVHDLKNVRLTGRSVKT